MYSTPNEGKSVATERFIRTLNNKIYKYMTSISKNVYIDKLDDIVYKYKTMHIIEQLKMKPVDVKPGISIDSNKEINKKDQTFEICVIVRILSCKNILEKAMFQIGLKKFLRLKKLKSLCHQH